MLCGSHEPRADPVWRGRHEPPLNNWSDHCSLDRTRFRIVRNFTSPSQQPWFGLKPRRLFTGSSSRPRYAASSIRRGITCEKPSLLLHPPLQLARSPQPALAPCRSRLPRHRHPMSTRLAGFVIRGDGAGGARTIIALTGTTDIDMTTTRPATIAIDVGTATMTVHIIGAAGTVAWTTTIDEYGGCQRAAGLAPAAHRPSLLIKSGLLGSAARRQPAAQFLFGSVVIPAKPAA
jgi:hypothetical protein